MGRARDRASADLNGQEFILDADADTSISADTDDQIDIKIAGADDFQFTANTFTAQSGSTIAAQALTATTITTSSTVDVQGNEIILDDDGDTSITADTDDQIDLRVGGIDTFVVKPDVVEIKGSHPDLKLMDTDDTNYGGLFYNNGAINLSADHDATGATGQINFVIDGSTKAIINSAGDLALQTDSASLKFGADSEMVLSHSHNEGLKLLTTAATGSLLTLGTTSTSVSDEAFIGGIDFVSGSSPTVQARVHGKQEGTAEVGGHLSFETRASGGSLSERLKIDSIGRILATTTGARSIIGRGAYTGVTVDNGATTSVAGNNGVLYNMVMVSTGGGFGAVYSMAYNSTVQLIHGTGNFSASSGTSSSTNVYKSSGSHAVTLQNNTGSAVTYYILVLTSYD